MNALLPECLDDFIAEDNAVRVVDAFVEELDLHDLGFDGVRPACTGRPTKAFQGRLGELGMLELREGGRHYLAEAGKDAGGEWRPGPGGGYMLWPEGFTLPAD